MIFDLAGETLISSNNTLFLDKNTVFRSEDEETLPIDFDDDKIISILEKVKQNIYKALIYYWNNPSDLGLTVALLDLYYNDLDFLDNDSEKQLIIQKLCNKFSELEKQAPELSVCSTLSNTEKSAIQSHKKYLQQCQMKKQKKNKM
ncbi:31839_t:CDS:2, partial [Racocetra persica]